MMCPAPSAIHGEPLCCECQARFRGHLPMPRTEAALPYWVPPSLRPQKKKPPGTQAPVITVGGSVTDASSSSGSSSSPVIRKGDWPWGVERAPRSSSCPSAS
ncbi:hypothetical protein mRhiFer1_001730 [Rhinolophus ferrumequinum]|uniref:Uncharacterized protein n=1 Tax=Rhinolophus ferrumequinum TaxID=59479 RepID=A0A7J7SGV9_RHIFE|nr:hypothetical protein mRhiFer1_001730 [Rhinolophus ferrumequinum]